MEKRVAIVGAGASGLLASRYTMKKGFVPIVFEADERVGGVWAHTLESTRLQNTKEIYQFSDFPWPPSIKEVYPTNFQVMEYLESYAKHFDILPCIKFNSKVVAVDYVGESCEEMDSWDLWGGTGKAFGSKGKWHVQVQDTKLLTVEDYYAEFVILCTGLFSGHPNIPEFPPNEGPEVFRGKVMHSMDFSNLDNSCAAELIKNKRVAIIGSHKTAVDLAAECANVNGTSYPCTLVQRTVHWFLPTNEFCGLMLGFLYFNRFFELMNHKPGETFLFNILATLLSPLRWGISKFVESYLRCHLPLKKYGMLPKTTFDEEVKSCQITLLPDKFYENAEEGSIILKNSQSFSFCKEGLVVDGQPIETDLVIFATGFKGDEKLKNIFRSQFLQDRIMGLPTSPIPLYRQILPPRIPQLAVIGHSESFSSLGSYEMRSAWLAQFLDGNLELPPIREMEKEAKMWGDHIKRVAGRYFRRTCISSTNIWYTDQLCRDMGHSPKRKKGFLAELFAPYLPTDYSGVTAM